MLRTVLPVISKKIVSGLVAHPSTKKHVIPDCVKTLLNQQTANFTSMVPAAPVYPSQSLSKYMKYEFLQPQQVSSEQIRTVIKFSLKKGKRKSVKAVRERFYRLHWGIWIRTMAGRFKKLWKKSYSQRNRLKNHVFCNATQSRMLDKMVNKFWRKPKYYIEDPMARYNTREEFAITRKKPWRPEGVDYE